MEIYHLSQIIDIIRFLTYLNICWNFFIFPEQFFINHFELVTFQVHLLMRHVYVITIKLFYISGQSQQVLILTSIKGTI